MLKLNRKIYSQLTYVPSSLKKKKKMYQAGCDVITVMINQLPNLTEFPTLFSSLSLSYVAFSPNSAFLIKPSPFLLHLFRICKNQIIFSFTIYTFSELFFFTVQSHNIFFTLSFISIKSVYLEIKFYLFLSYTLFFLSQFPSHSFRDLIGLIMN